MSEQPNQMQQMKPYIFAAVALLVLLLVVVFWPSGEDAPSKTAVPQTNLPEPVAVEENTPEVVEEDVYEPLPETKPVVVSTDEEVSPVELAPPVVEVDKTPEPAIEIDDETIKAALKEVIDSPQLMKFLVSDSLLQRFVINVNELANGEIAPRNQLVQAPDEDFRVYQQANSTYIDPASFQRYTPYVEVLEAADVDQLTTALETFRPEIEKRFQEISRPGETFNQSLIKAIDVLLNTPQVPVPIEVYSDSVAYKFKDERLENLPEPQKQLLRTGPENMRRIKDVLKELKAELEK